MNKDSGATSHKMRKKKEERSESSTVALRQCCSAMSDEINNEALEEERLMRAMSRQGKTPRGTVVAKKAEPAPVAAAPEKKAQPAGAVPEWKRRQLERENSEQIRLAEEKQRKEDSARLIAQRVAEFGSNVDQEDEKVLEYLQSPRSGDKPDVSSPSWEHEPQLQKDVPKEEEAEAAVRTVLLTCWANRLPARSSCLLSLVPPVIVSCRSEDQPTSIRTWLLPLDYCFVLEITSLPSSCLATLSLPTSGFKTTLFRPLVSLLVFWRFFSPCILGSSILGFS